MPKITERDIKELEDFILQELPKRLKRDLRNLRIIKEADLECSAYFHLRKFIGRDDSWRILARKHTQWTGYHVDLLLFRRAEPVFAFELKWNKDEITDKDETSLRSALRDLGVRRTYWICAQPQPGQGVEVRSGDTAKELHIFVRPGFKDKLRFKEWRDGRRKYTKEMDQGERAKK